MSEAIDPRPFVESTVDPCVLALAVHATIPPLALVDGRARCYLRVCGIRPLTHAHRKHSCSSICLVTEPSRSTLLTKLHASIAMTLSVHELPFISTSTAASHKHALAMELIFQELALVSISCRGPSLLPSPATLTASPLTVVHTSPTFTRKDAMAMTKSLLEATLVAVSVCKHNGALAMTDAVNKISCVGATHELFATVQCKSRPKWRKIIVIPFSRLITVSHD